MHLAGFQIARAADSPNRTQRIVLAALAIVHSHTPQSLHLDPESLFPLASG